MVLKSKTFIKTPNALQIVWVFGLILSSGVEIKMKTTNKVNQNNLNIAQDEEHKTRKCGKSRSEHLFLLNTFFFLWKEWYWAPRLSTH